jgi:hypothetical protein
MTIHPHDHILRFRFESEARPDISHVVDLGAFGGFGECSCEDFQFRLLPALSRHQSPTGSRCKHLLAAREALLGQLIDRITAGNP